MRPGDRKLPPHYSGVAGFASSFKQGIFPVLTILGCLCYWEYFDRRATAQEISAGRLLKEV